MNRPVDHHTATAITSTFIEAVVAPAADAEARAVFATKKNLRLVLADCRPAAADLRLTRELRSILGAILVQEYDHVTEAASPWGSDSAGLGRTELRVVTTRHPAEEEWAALRLAWRVCAHVKSNVFATKKNLRLVLADCRPAAADLRLTRELRSILGAILVQEYDHVTEAASPWGSDSAGLGRTELRVVTTRHPAEEEWAALRLAWRVCAHVKSTPSCSPPPTGWWRSGPDRRAGSVPSRWRR